MKLIRYLGMMPAMPKPGSAAKVVLGGGCLEGVSSAPAQQAALMRFQQQLVCVDIGVLLQDPHLLLRAAHAAFETLRPILTLAGNAPPPVPGGGQAALAASPLAHGDGGLWRFLLRPLAALQLALATLPPALPETTSRPVRSLRASVAAALAQAGRATGEVEAAKTALLQLTRPEEKSEGANEAEAQPASPAKGGSPRAGDEAEGGEGTAAPPVKMTSGPTQLQWSLYEVWMSSAGVSDGLTTEDLRRVLDLPEPLEALTADMLTIEDGGGGGKTPAKGKDKKGKPVEADAGAEPDKPPPPLEDQHMAALILVGARTCPTEPMVEGAPTFSNGGPDAVWKLLQHPRIRSHPNWCRYACHVMSAALAAGMGGAGGALVQRWAASLTASADPEEIGRAHV